MWFCILIFVHFNSLIKNELTRLLYKEKSIWKTVELFLYKIINEIQ